MHTILLLLAGTAVAMEYPGAEWATHSKVGWSVPLLQAAHEYTRTRQTSSVMIVQGGRVVDNGAT